MTGEPFDDAPEGRPYPPAHHLLRDLDVELETVDDAASRAWLAVDPSDPAGRLEDLLVAVDVTCGLLVGRVVAPDWMATSDLSVHLGPAPSSTTLVATATVLRAGRTTVVVDVDVRDGRPDGPRCAAAVAAFSRLPRREGNLTLAAAVPGERARMAGPGAAPGAVRAGLDVEVADAAGGVASAPVGAWAHNSFGAVNGGVVAAVAARVATAQLGAALGPAVELTSLGVHYLAQATVGPLAAVGSVLRPGPAEGAVRLDLVDVGRIDEGAAAGPVPQVAPGRPVAVAHVAGRLRATSPGART